jgi:ACS family hexuronate transporter-like MFS transporter
MIHRWRIAVLVSAGIAISYLDRQTLPVAIGAIQKDIPVSNQAKALLDSAFLLTYGLMYVGGGRLMDRLGTRRGFLLIMIFWSLACASHAFAAGVVMLVVSRLLLGVGEGGGFPAATRAVAEWFPVRDRSTAMGIINAGTGIGGIVAPLLIAAVIQNVNWFGISPWRWVFLITGTLGLVWTVWWASDYFTPAETPLISAATPVEEERGWPQPQHVQVQGSQPGGIQACPTVGAAAAAATCAPTRRYWQAPIRELLRFREMWGLMGAKFLTDAAWYFYMFWLPKYLLDARGFDIKSIGSVAWIPFAAATVGCLVGGGLSSLLLRRGHSVNAARKIALGVSAAVMPWVMLVPHVSVPWVIFFFSLAFFGQQSWSTLVMTLPTDLFPRQALGTVAGFVGLGGALGGMVLGQLAGYLLDHGVTYGPVLVIAGSLHVLAFLVILAVVRSVKPLSMSFPNEDH